jgi:hypothetical protein
LTLLERREIEARIVGPLIRAFANVLGEVATMGLVRAVISDLARDAGADLAKALGDCSLIAFERAVDRWTEGGALELDVLERSEAKLSFNVTRCRFAEMYGALGMADFGASLSCQRDFALIEGFSPSVTLSRTQTIMGGAPYCDFRFETRASGPKSDPEKPSAGA